MGEELERPGTAQAAAFAYTSNFAKAGSEDDLSAEALADFVARDQDGRQRYQEAFARSSLRAMMHYYRQDSERYVGGSPVNVPVLQFHRLNDPALLADSLNNTWKHLANTWTLITIPGAGHWPHHDQPELVTNTMLALLQQPLPDLAEAAEPGVPFASTGPTGGDEPFDCCGTGTT